MACLSDTKPQAKYQCRDHKGRSQTNVWDLSQSQNQTNEYLAKSFSMTRNHSTCISHTLL